MRYETLFQKKEKLHQILKKIPKEALDSFERSFDVEYTHNSTAIEGNTLTLIQTKAIIEDGISVGGKTLREIFEVTNHAKAFSYVKESVSKNLPLDEVFISHADCIEEAEYVAERIKNKYGVKNIVINDICPTVGAHTGKGVVVAAYFGCQR